MMPRFGDLLDLLATAQTLDYILSAMNKMTGCEVR